MEGCKVCIWQISHGKDMNLPSTEAQHFVRHLLLSGRLFAFEKERFCNTIAPVALIDTNSKRLAFAGKNKAAKVAPVTSRANSLLGQLIRGF